MIGGLLAAKAALGGLVELVALRTSPPMVSCHRIGVELFDIVRDDKIVASTFFYGGLELLDHSGSAGLKGETPGHAGAVFGARRHVRV